MASRSFLLRNRIPIAKGEEIGLAKGKELGIEEGIKANAIETARKMKALGIDEDAIVQITGLSLEEIGSE